MKKKTMAGLAALGAFIGIATVAGVANSKRKKRIQLAGKDNKSLPPKRNIYFAGGGLAALSGAYYLIRDCNIPGEDIYIFEESGSIGGAFNVGGDAETGYVCTPPKLLSLRNHSNLMDMLGGLKSANLDDMSVKDEIVNFMNANPINENMRIADENGISVCGFGLDKNSIKRIKTLLAAKDYVVSEMTVDDYFDDCNFTASNLWILISSTYMLRNESSAAELKHVINCISGEIPELYTMKNVLRSQFNLQSTVISALEQYLTAHNVNFATHCCVTDVDFNAEDDTISAIHLNDNGTAKTYYFNKNDLFFITNGSISECATIGDYNYPAPVSDKTPVSAALWQNICEKRDGFGNPAIFYDADDSGIISFTITSKSSKLADMIKEYTSNTSGGILTTFAASPWGLTISTVPQPYFEDQSDDISVICGYGITPEAEGLYIDKQLKHASGAEILFELVKLIGKEEQWDEITSDIINVIPCLMPYATASSLPYSDEEKPLVVKDKNSNFAFIGQFAKLGTGISYSSEYAVRTAREAVYRLTGTKKSSTPPPKAVRTSYLKLFSALKK